MMYGAALLMAVMTTAVAQPQRQSEWLYVHRQHHQPSIQQPRSGLTLPERPPFGLTNFQRPRQGRRIGGSRASLPPNVLVTSTTPASTGGKKLVTLRPIGNSIQDILYNNGYRDRPAELRPPRNNIDNYAELDDLDPSEVWLLQDGLMVLKGGSFSNYLVDTEPLDDYQAPYREPRFPPPGFQPDTDLFSGAPLSSRNVQPPPHSFTSSARDPLSASAPGHEGRSLHARRLGRQPRPVSSPGRYSWQQPAPVQYPREEPKGFSSGSPQQSPTSFLTPSTRRGGNYYVYTSPQADYSITYTTSSQR